MNRAVVKSVQFVNPSFINLVRLLMYIVTLLDRLSHDNHAFLTDVHLSLNSPGGPGGP